MTGVFVALLLVAQAPPGTGVLRGQVIDATTSAPIAGVQVAVAALAREVLSDTEGRFELPDLPPGRHTVSASIVGFAFARRDVDVLAGSPTWLTMRLTEGSGTYRESVTVTADAGLGEGPAGAAVRQAGAGTLQDLRGVAADDPMRAVQALPGVVTGDDFQAEFSVRGAAFRHLGVVMDGVDASGLLHAVRGADDTGSVAMINTDVLTRASLFTGAHARRYGDWLGATLEFDVRQGSRERTAVSGAVSGTSASAVVEGPIGRSGRGSWLASVRKSYIDWLIRKVEPEIDSTIGFGDALVKVVFDVTPRQQVQVLVVAGDAVYRQLVTPQANGVKRATSGSTLAAGRWRLARERWLLTQHVTFAGTDFRNHGALGQELARGYSQTVGWQGEAALALRPGWTIEGGGAFGVKRLNQILREYSSVGTGQVRLRDAEEITARFATSSAWVQAARSSTAGHVTIGLRASDRDSAGSMLVLPWLMAERRTGLWTWRASVGRSGQLADPILAGAESAERATHADLGVEHRLTTNVRWSVTAFARADDGLVGRVGEARLDPTTGGRVQASLFPAFANQWDGTTRGVDILVGRQAPEGLTGWAGYTFSRSRVADEGSGERFDGDFDQRHTLNLFARQRLSYRLSVSAKLRVGSNVPVVGYFEETGDTLRLSPLRNRVRLPVYARLDLKLTRTFDLGRRRMTLFAEVMNALGRRNLRQSAGTVRSTLEVLGALERLVPFVPSAGVLIEF